MVVADYQIYKLGLSLREQCRAKSASDQSGHPAMSAHMSAFKGIVLQNYFERELEPSILNLATTLQAKVTSAIRATLAFVRLLSDRLKSQLPRSPPCQNNASHPCQ